MARVKKNTALSKKKALERALQAENVIDMELFFDARKDSNDYWRSAMIIAINNITREQKIRLAHRVIIDEDAMAFFYKHLFDLDDEY